MADQPEDQPGSSQPEKGEKKWADQHPDPFPRASIDLGDGRTLKLLRTNRFQQMQIEIIPQQDGVDPRPTKEDTGYLKDRGWQWRHKEKVWARPLGKNTPDDHMARANSDKEAETHFFELANRIRERNGLEPVSHSLGQSIV